jgi:hypothetical protein
LKELANLKELRELILFQCRGVTGTGLKNLADLPRLEFLFMQDTSVTDAALKDIAVFKSLKTLNVQQSKVTKEGLQELRKTRPDLRINP